MNKPVQTESSRVIDVFGVELRSLAAFRIGAALLILSDLWFRSHELTAYFTDLGVLPRTARIELYELNDQFGFSQMWSLHMLSGQFWVQALLLLIGAVFALCMLVGYRTRLASIATWLLLLSLDSRNPMILNSGDVLLRCCLFWALTLPMGARWSLDALLRPPLVQRTHVCSVASFALLMQLAVMYFFSALVKTHPAWLSERSAVYYALNCDAYVRPLGIYLRQFPILMEGMTLGTYLLELVGPVIVFSPFATRKIRLVTVIIFWLFHLGLGMTMTIGLFPAICMVAWLPFLPGEFWDRVQRWFDRPELREIVPRLRAVLRANVNESGEPRWFRYPERPASRQSLWLNLLMAPLLLYVVIWNVREMDVNYWETKILPRQLNGVARTLGLDQNWHMFSPIPRTADGWLVMQGILRDGTEVNLWEPGEPLPWDKPELVSALYKDQRWRKYLDNLTTEPHAIHRMYFVNWLRWRWNEYHSDGDPQREVVKVEVTHQIEVTPPKDEPFTGIESKVLWTWYYE